jgi:hypothetical protein
MIQINSVTIPTPSDYKISVMDLSKAERNANGNMIIERVATKRKLELEYKYLSSNDLSVLLQAISDVFFTVSYPDFVTGSINSGTFYVGDRTAGAIDYQNDIIRYKDIKFNLIER